MKHNFDKFLGKQRTLERKYFGISEAKRHGYLNFKRKRKRSDSILRQTKNPRTNKIAIKKLNDNKNATKCSIKQRLRTDLGRSVVVNTVIHFHCLYMFMFHKMIKHIGVVYIIRDDKLHCIACTNVNIPMNWDTIRRTTHCESGC